MVESVQELREQFDAPAPPQTAPQPLSPAKREPDPPAGDETVVYRPLQRLPTLKLCILDDGSRDQGEWIRIRKPSFKIGRVEGDLIIGHDIDMSGKHCEIVARTDAGQYRFFLKDLGSRNGTFLRVSRLLLRKDQTIIFGAKRYQFDPGSASQAQEPAQASDNSTRGWQAVKPESIENLFPSLVEQTPNGPGKRLEIRKDEMLLGRDAQQCGLVISDDPFVSPVHALISRDQKGRWKLENQGSLNGVWLRVQEVPLDGDAEIQAGEQRILVRFPPRM